MATAAITGSTTNGHGVSPYKAIVSILMSKTELSSYEIVSTSTHILHLLDTVDLLINIW
jgi:hypothetical protein